MARSSLNCDIRDLNELGYIRGLGRRNKELYDDWIAKQHKRVAELEQLVKELEGVDTV